MLVLELGLRMRPSSASTFSAIATTEFVSSSLLILATASTLCLLAAPCLATQGQDPLTDDELLSTLLGEDDSPPLSQENGVTILGTGAVDPATTLDCHRRLYSYRVRFQFPTSFSWSMQLIPSRLHFPLPYKLSSL